MRRRFAVTIDPQRPRSPWGGGLRGFTILESTAVIMILGIIVCLVLPRLSENSADSKRNACYVNKGDIEVQAELWYRKNGSWPATDLGNIGADAAYFPDGLPTCPVDGTGYVLDGITHQVTGHDQPSP